MSLINDMLKGLEHREIRHDAGLYVPFTTTNQRIRKWLPNHRWLTIVAVSALLCSPFFIRHHKTSTLAPMLPETAHTALPTTKSAAWLTTSTINGVTLQLKDGVTELSFLLDHPVLYRLVSDGMENRLSIIFDRTNLQAELPVINTSNTPIERIATTKTKEAIRFDLTLYPGAIVKYVNLQNESKNPELVVSIEYNPHTGTAQQSDNQSTDALVKTAGIDTMLRQRYESALVHAENSDYESAIIALTGLVKEKPTYQDARVSLAALLIDQGDSRQAKQVIEDGLQLIPDSVPLLELKARLFVRDGKLKQAITLLQQASPSLEENPGFHAFRAALYQEANNDTLAIKIYKQLLNIDPRNSSWWFGLGLSLEKIGRQNLAYEAYSRAVNEGHLNPDSMAYAQTRIQAIQNENEEKRS